MTIGMTNAAPAGGGGGGDWTLRTPSNDWSDIFEASGSNTITAKKDIFLKTTGTIEVCSFIPKGYKTASNLLKIPATGETLISTSEKVVDYALQLARNNISSGNLSSLWNDQTFTTDGSTVTITMTAVSYTFYKSSVEIYVKE